jgi:hypothetical protein
MTRSLPLFAALLLAGCKTPTEVVVKLDGMGITPSLVDVRLHRTEVFNDVPAMTALPGFVTPLLDGADLILEVTPPGPSTLMSLLPSPTGPKDLMVSVTAPGFAVEPMAAQDGSFVDNVSKTLTFTLTAIPPDMAMPPDLRVRHDLSSAATDGPPTTD